MTHCSDDDLILGYYHEPDRPLGAAEHLRSCEPCRARYQALATVLDGIVIPEAPEPGNPYGLELWSRLAPRLPEREPFWRVGWLPSLSMAAAAALLAVGFVAGRSWPRPDPASAVAVSAPGLRETGGDEARRRVLLASVADHLERSGRVLSDIINASGESDISIEQQWASDLLSAGRFYRQQALASREPMVASVLDGLERALLEIVHSPSSITRDELDEMSRRVDSAALLFQVRILSGELRHREAVTSVPAAKPFSSTRTS